MPDDDSPAPIGKFRFIHRSIDGDVEFEWHNISIYGGTDLKRPRMIQLYFAGIDDEIEMEITDEKTLHKMMNVLIANVAALRVKKEKKSRGDMA